LDDPYVAPAERAPRTDEVTVALIGGGFAGLVTGARLVQAGITDVRIIEKGGDVGGTWYWNRYPGAQCDVESYVYLPLLEETGYVPTEKYAHAPEIQEHCRRIARHFGLYDNACLSTEVTGLEWDADASRWIIHTTRGDAMRARFVVMGNGPLHRPKLPGIPGIETFRGHSFHTSRWDYDYTGGDAGGGLDRLADKRVGIIGTGATAVQCVPHLATACQELYVFQRTPSGVDQRANRPTDPEWAASLEPGWQAERIANFTALTSGGMASEDLVMDGWTEVFRRVVATITESGDASPKGIARALEDSDFQKMDEIRARVDDLVADPATAEALKPWYRQFCKRPCFHDEYLQSFNEPGVQLVDTDGRGVERITETGVVVDGREYELDCLIYATGFEVGTEYTRRAGYDLVGRDGLTLSQHWAQGMRSLHGMHVHGFPNAFVVGHAQGGFTANYPHLLEECATQLVHVIGTALERGIDEVEVTAAAEEAWVREILDNPPRFSGFGNTTECTPGYYNNEGRPGAGPALGGFYGGGPLAFFRLLADWRAAGDLEGLSLS
ncbi:MAG: NAD(P)/FAD-dependent oxidoreductase, partial [Acidimicrobiales bacterium]